MSLYCICTDKKYFLLHNHNNLIWQFIVTFFKDEHSAKQLSRREVTEEGIVTELSEEHRENDILQIVVSEEGIVTDLSDK